MKTKTWAMFGSLLINLMLGLLVAAVFSVAPAAHAAEPGHCAGAHAEHVKQSPAAPARPVATRRSYLVDARMGWGPAG